MEYDDYVMPSTSEIENMAREYSLALKNQGFMFVQKTENEKNLQQILPLLKRLHTCYSRLGFNCKTRWHKNSCAKACEFAKRGITRLERKGFVQPQKINTITAQNNSSLIREILVVLGNLVSFFSSVGSAEWHGDIITIGELIKDLSNFV